MSSIYVTSGAWRGMLPVNGALAVEPSLCQRSPSNHPSHAIEPLLSLSMAGTRTIFVSLSSHAQSTFGLRGLVPHHSRIAAGGPGALFFRSTTTNSRVASWPRCKSSSTDSARTTGSHTISRSLKSSEFRCCIHSTGSYSSDKAKPKKNKNVEQHGNIHASTGRAANKPQSAVASAASSAAKLSTKLKSTLKLDSVRHENIYNLPNFLTLTRLLATPAIGYLIIHNHHLYAFSLFAYAAVSDLLDGWIARRWHLQTVVGSVVDPMADKFLMTTLVTCLAVNGSLSLPLFALILGRDVSLAISAFYYRYASLPAPKTMARYWDFSLPSAEVHPTTISKLNTFLQLTLLGTLLCTNLLHDPSATSSAAGGLLLSIQDLLGGEEGVKVMIQGISAIVASTTIYSGLEYTWSKKAVVILGGDEALKRKQGFRGRMIMANGFGSFIALAVWLWYKERDGEKDRQI